MREAYDRSDLNGKELLASAPARAHTSASRGVADALLVQGGNKIRRTRVLTRQGRVLTDLPFQRARAVPDTSHLLPLFAS